MRGVIEWAPLDGQQATAQSSQQSAGLSNIIMLLLRPTNVGMNGESERLSRRISIRADARPKAPRKNATLMECEADKIASADKAIRGTSAQ